MSDLTSDMTLNISKPTRLAILVLASITAIILSWLSIRTALAEHYANQNTLSGYEKAVHLEPDNPQYWYLLGNYLQNNMYEPNAERAIRAYKTSLSLYPRNADAWLNLAEAYETRGDLEAARNSFLEAKHAYPASANVLWQYGNFLIRQNQLDTGFTEIRHAVEADPKLGLQAFIVCSHADPDFDIVLNKVLPPFPSVYLDVMWQLTDERRSDLALKVWSRLVPLHPRLQPRDVLYFVDGLIFNGQLPKARKAWNQAVELMDIAAPSDPAGSLVWDGSFETGLTGGGFAWRLQPQPGSSANLDSDVSHSGKQSLRIDFDGSKNLNFGAGCQYVPVAPNITYRLSGWLRSENLSTDHGVFLRLDTANSASNTSASTEQALGTTSWTQVALNWTSPRDVQLVRICAARTPTQKPDEQISGTVWVDDVSLVPLSVSDENAQR